MDIIFEKVLENTVATLDYASAVGFPTRALITRNINYMPEYIDRISFSKGSFLQAFDLLRQKKVTVLSSQKVFSFVAYNPAMHDPAQLFSAPSLPAKHTIAEYVNNVKKQCGDLVSRGNINMLNREEKKTLIELFTLTDPEHLDDLNLDSAIEDLKYARADFRTIDKFEIGHFLGFYLDSPQDIFMKQVLERWISLVKIYAKLSLMEKDLTEEDRELIKSIKYPNVEQFNNETEIMNYWPFTLSPRPRELNFKS